MVDDVVSKLRSSLEKLASLSAPQEATLILRSCLGAAKVTYLLRLLNPDLGDILAQKASVIIKEALGDIVGVPLSELQWNLARLPVKSGGLGITDPMVISSVARISSFISAARHSSTTQISLHQLAPTLSSSLITLLPLAPSAANPLLSIIQRPYDHDVITSHSLSEEWSQQKQWTEIIYQKLGSQWSANASDRMVRLKELFSGVHSANWLTCTPRPGIKFTAPQWQSLLRWRLSVPIGFSTLCPGCHQSMDRLGDHALSCHALGIYARHNALRDWFHQQFEKVGYRCIKEVPVDSTLQRPADLLVENFSASGDLAVDVSVVHPLRFSLRPAMETSGRLAHERQEQKNIQYKQLCNSQGWDFTTAVAETTGAWAPQGQQLINKLARLSSMQSGSDIKTTTSSLWLMASACIAHTVSCQLLQAFTENVPVPFATTTSTRTFPPPSLLSTSPLIPSATNTSSSHTSPLVSLPGVQ